MAAAPPLPPVLAAIDVGTNAVRLELARVDSGGALETLHQERDAIRPGEGVFATGLMPEETAQRLLATLRRYAALCKRHKARVRAVGTSALREARNRDAIVQRVREESGLELEVVSGQEEARLICLGVLHGRPAGSRSLLVDIGGGSTEVATAVGERPTQLWSLSLGAVRLTELFEASGKVSPKRLRLMRSYVREALQKTLPKRADGMPKVALGSSGTINAVVGFAASEGTAHASARQLTQAVEALVELPPERRRKRFDSRRADIIVAGAVVLEGVARHLKLDAVTGVNRGLRDGLLVDLLHRQDTAHEDHSLQDAALAIGRRFGFEERHCRHVTALALTLFDELAALHQLPVSTRPYLEVAGLLHDVGNAVNYERHHKHTYYLVRNSELPGLSEAERDLVARVARYHRRSPPDPAHSGMQGLSAQDARTVRRLATLLRLANSLDRSHHQLVRSVRATTGRDAVSLHLKARAPVDLELWSAEHEALHFRRVFGKRLTLHLGR
ncbi:Ppx/GppA family phosphatase [Aggregicoccus sp. 17bor-14]|uniref:Ppx/GppA phosphatase family protein n=1 Tax=Myxococcaceae TaxID=31 RepID=UPI00129C6239|nr:MULTISPECIES: Ppx/GppA phosphatase family protein [Myxococcaceae]MBF5042409.1 Ppx/GppA family phosphatase [Simulacricoccus sp. 17bor-14]MRI88181.1 Ppx/GppA family phosphatase [Aggregicoccus sp. 17bor-14]